jgi:flagellar hook assembly protein FlgD
MMVRPRSTLVAALAAAAIAVPVCLAVPAEAGSRAGLPTGTAPAVAVTGTNSPFSPNADGSKDRGTLTYRLAKRAYVTVRITAGNSNVLTTKVGRARKGNHTFVWDGKRAGRIVNDGTYTVSVLSRARKYGRARVASTRLVVDARVTPDTGIVRLSSDTVYPRTTVIQDEVVGNFFPAAGFNPTSNLEDTAGYATVRRLVLNASGRIVDSAPLEIVKRQPHDTSSEYGYFESAPSCAYSCGRFTWDGRDSRGEVVAAGTYRVRLERGRDRAGNVQVLAPEVVVQVSTTALAPTTRTTTLPPAGAPTLSVKFPEGCNGCADGYNSVIGSTRFDGGLTYDTVCRADNLSSSPTYCVASSEFVLAFNGRRTPSDKITVTARGGPTTPGGTDTGVLVAGDGTARRSATMQGDTTVKIIDASFAYNSEVPLRARPSGLRWSVSASRVPDNSYDLASLDVAYTTYEPAR